MAAFLSLAASAQSNPIQFTDVTAAAGIKFVHFKGNEGTSINREEFWIVVNANPPLLLHSSGNNGNHFLNFKLVGVKSNRDAMGAKVRVMAGGISQIREIAGGSSYLSQSELRANFGLGKATRAETVEVQWPSGQHQVFRNIEVDKFYLIEEGKQEMGQQHLLAGPARSEKH